MGAPTNEGIDPLRAALEKALGAQYEVLRLLGRGGMGAVYLARERLLERLVAIKVLPQEHAEGEARERFLREARTVAHLSHPNIVPLLSFGEMEGTLFYIMRFVEGESLEARLRREGRLSHDEVRSILGELADALTEAHRQGVVHRDLKPDNVMMDQATGRPMLTDFGVARQPANTSTLTGTGMIVGTPQYMSPEQAAGDRAVDGRSDLYALGVMGYRMLTGRLPFAGEDTREILMKHISVAPTPVTSLMPDAPLDLSDGIMRCLAKDPTDRWTDARSLRFALTPSAGVAAVPESLETIPRIGTRALLMAYFFTGGLVALYAYTKDVVWLQVDAVVCAGGLGAIFASVLVRGRAAGVSWRRSLAMALWPSSGSAMWWPRALRPPGDLFDQLPTPVRRARIIQSSAVALLLGPVAALILAGCIAGGDHFDLRRRLMLSGLALNLFAMFVVMGPSIAALGWRKKWQLTRQEANKLLMEPTHGSRFWERPAIAALLSKAVTGHRPVLTVEGMSRAISDIAASFPSAARSLGADAIAAAAELAREIKAIDARIADIAGQSDPAERQRLQERLASLGPERPSDSDMTRQMRTLLRGQAALFGELAAREESLRVQRNRLHDQLRGLHLQMANYRAQLAASGDGSPELSEKIREITRQIERRVDATREVDDITSLTART